MQRAANRFVEDQQRSRLAETERLVTGRTRPSFLVPGSVLRRLIRLGDLAGLVFDASLAWPNGSRPITPARGLGSAELRTEHAEGG